MNILAIIPARKNSKRLPDKNIKILRDKPLISYTIEEALKSKYITDIVITTDDRRILEIADKYKIRVLWRPFYLCEDNTPIEKVIDYVKNHCRKSEIFILLQPTSPLRTAKNIDNCIELLINSGFDSVITVRETFPHTFYPNGAVYVFRNQLWSENMGMILMPREKSVDIDTMEDFREVERILNGQNTCS